MARVQLFPDTLQESNEQWKLNIDIKKTNYSHARDIILEIIDIYFNQEKIVRKIEINSQIELSRNEVKILKYLKCLWNDYLN